VADQEIVQFDVLLQSESESGDIRTNKPGGQSHFYAENSSPFIGSQFDSSILTDTHLQHAVHEEQSLADRGEPWHVDPTAPPKKRLAIL
jgi:hypothetical protein